MIRFTNEQTYRAIFEVKTNGPVVENDVVGAVIAHTSGLFQEYAITKLQQTKKVGHIRFHAQDQNRTGRVFLGTLEVPINLERVDASILCAALESTTKIGAHNAQIKLVKISDSYGSKRYQIIHRAKQIYTKHFETDSAEGEVEKLKQSLNAILDKSKTSTVGRFTLGPEFYDEQKIILVEGKADINTLFKYGIGNTIAVGGLDYDSSALDQLLKDKEITLFLDGDRGGNLLGEKLKQHVVIKDVVPTPKNTSVEDLSKRQVLTLLSQRSPWL